MTKRHPTTPVVLALVLGLTASLVGEPSEPKALRESGEPFHWMQDLDKAREVAAAQNKPLLLVFRCVP